MFNMATTLIPLTTLGFYIPNGKTTLNRTLLTITSALSLLGALVIIITYITWKDIRSSSRKILVYISIADCITVGSYMFGAWLPPETTSSTACIVQSFISTTAILWSFFWTTFMAIFLYITVARQKPLLAEKIFQVFHVIGWGVPVFVVGVALAEKVLGNDRDLYSSGWCWIKVQELNGKLSPRKNIVWLLVTGKAWDAVAFVLVLVFYGLLKCHIHKEVYCNERQHITSPFLETAKKADKKLSLVPVVFLFLRLWGVLRFCIYLASPMHELESMRNFQTILLYFQGVCECSQGFANFVLFCLLGDKFERNAKRTLYQHCPYCYRCSYKPNSSDITENCLPYSEECSEMIESSPRLPTSDPSISYGSILPV